MGLSSTRISVGMSWEVRFNATAPIWLDKPLVLGLFVALPVPPEVVGLTGSVTSSPKAPWYTGCTTR